MSTLRSSNDVVDLDPNVDDDHVFVLGTDGKFSGRGAVSTLARTFGAARCAAVRSCGAPAVLALVLGAATPTVAQTVGATAAPGVITQPIDPAKLAVLAGNTRPEALNPANDRGRVADTLALPHMLLQLRRPAETEQALNELIDRLHDPTSPDFHHWLNAEQIGAQFGPAASDLQAITTWLVGNGFTVNTVYPSGMVIDFSGTAGPVRTAFHTEIHNLVVNGKEHIANINDPQIPAALTPAVAGIVSLHDFRPKPQYSYTSEWGETAGNTYYYLVPADLWTIYNFNPLFSAGISGQGQTITVVEHSDPYTYNPVTGDDPDWDTFRSKFGLSPYGGELTVQHPAPTSGPNNCADPSYDPNKDPLEAALDPEWASAAAPDASIVVASCADVGTTGGFIIAAENLINQPSPPAIISISFGECEVTNGNAANAAINSAYQQGVLEGVSIFVAAGDQDADVCDGGVATQGINVNAWASTIYNVAVGGTDFQDTYLGENRTYWNSKNTSNYGSAKSYVPEMAWNSSCGSQQLVSWYGFKTAYGSSGLCNSGVPAGIDSTYGYNFLLSNGGGSGGPSNCGFLALRFNPVFPFGPVYFCSGWSKPSWQSGVVGIPDDGVRDLPDVSMFAGGLYPWRHAYVFCFSDTAHNGGSCSGAPSTWDAGAGTSFSAPIVAGIQALVNQYWGSGQGNPNKVYYPLAAVEQLFGGSKNCNSTLGNKVYSGCAFYDVTVGDNDAPCTGAENCYRPSGKYGVLSTSDSTYEPAYPATTGYDLATGLGTINAYNLVMNWGGVSGEAPSP